MLTRTPLLEQASGLRHEATSRAPGRSAALIDRRVAELLDVETEAPPLPTDLTGGEQVMLGIVEQFMIDVHGITDARFAELSDHYSNEEQVAIMFQLALADGFTKLAKVDGEST